MNGWWAWLCLFLYNFFGFVRFYQNVVFFQNNVYVFAFFAFNDEFKCFGFILSMRVLENFLNVHGTFSQSFAYSLNCPSSYWPGGMFVCMYGWLPICLYVGRLSVCLKSFSSMAIYCLAELIFRFQWFFIFNGCFLLLLLSFYISFSWFNEWFQPFTFITFKD